MLFKLVYVDMLAVIPSAFLCSVVCWCLMRGLMESLRVSSSAVVVHTPSIASCRHPEKGRILFARRSFEKDEEIAMEQSTSIIKRYFDNMDEFRQNMDNVKV